MRSVRIRSDSPLMAITRIGQIREASRLLPRCEDEFGSIDVGVGISRQQWKDKNEFDLEPFVERICRAKSRTEAVFAYMSGLHAVWDIKFVIASPDGAEPGSRLTRLANGGRPLAISQRRSPVPRP